MSTASVMVLDLLVGVVAAAAWLGAGATAATGRARVAAGLAAVAVTATAGRGATVAGLAAAGWWFGQEKLTLTLPLLLVAAATAVVLAGPALARAARHGGGSALTGPRVVVPLLAAGYAAVAGPGVTLLVGYPVTWTAGLLTVALVAGAVLLTWRIATPARSAPRRLAAVAAIGLGVAGLASGFAPAPRLDPGGGPPAGQADAQVDVRDLRGPDTPAPGGQVRRVTLTAGTATVTLGSGHRLEAWTFNGQVPGPAITATEGDLIEVTLRNRDIDRGVTLHWHGYEVPAGEDGVPGLTQEAVAPGERFVYRFRAEQVGTYWYHTHRVSDVGVRKGLYGTLVVRPAGAAAEGLDLTVPVHTFDGVPVVGDRDGTVTHRVAPGTPVRLRLVNTDNLPRRFALSGTPYRLVAVDGRDLHRPGEVRRVALRLAAGGRYDVTFPMPASPVALAVGTDGGTGLRLLPEDGTGAAGAPDAGAAATPDTGDWPVLDLLGYGAPAATPFDQHSRFDRDFTLVLDRGVAMGDGVPGYAHTINGRAWPHVPTGLVAAGDLVRITVVNRSLEVHPWHLHGHRVLVLSRDGRPVTGSPLWMDTFDVRPGEVWQVAFRADNPGVWMNHCHNLPHAAQGMMMHLAYDGVTTPYHH